MLPLIFLFFLFSPSESCLKVNYPKCDCKFLAMNDRNLEENSGKFYSELFSKPMKAPVITIEDCDVSAICEDAGFSLVVIDEDQKTTFGEHEATGFCNPLTQKWQISQDSGFKTFNRLNAVCIGQEKECNVCSMDGIVTERAEPYNLINYTQFQTFDISGECEYQMDVICRIASGWDCTVFDVMGAFGQKIRKITYVWANEDGYYAWSALGCEDNGQYTHSYVGLKPSSLWCNMQSCTPLPPQQIGKSKNY
ncbi:hypothetical protein B9Z55_002750 [Caenorhabditis nigoni]|uniref:DUF281 domain-containing protein n=2 Tax=Caenorhabditis nigoni TaxID=1611254 RepID=A0A2G5VLY9_9PELO|nr:hypothetical protein B9Z55_002750 [Caenorhabditis nigoni]